MGYLNVRATTLKSMHNNDGLPRGARVRTAVCPGPHLWSGTGARLRRFAEGPRPGHSLDCEMCQTNRLGSGFFFLDFS